VWQALLNATPCDASAANDPPVTDEKPTYDQSAAIGPQIMMPAWPFGKKPCGPNLANYVEFHDHFAPLAWQIARQLHIIEDST
jgi:hypothetical protein